MHMFVPTRRRRTHNARTKFSIFFSFREKNKKSVFISGLNRRQNTKKKKNHAQILTELMKSEKNAYKTHYIDRFFFSSISSNDSKKAINNL